jgi:hypothetical protein
MNMHTVTSAELFDFFRQVQIIGISNDDCWNWTGGLNNYGYGRISVGGKRVLAHRYSYTLFKGKIPEGKVIDHLCRNRKCVNPTHMEPVTNSENVKRGEKKQRTYCIRGHLLSGSNLKIRKNGTRFCRACDRDRVRIKRQQHT